MKFSSFTFLETLLEEASERFAPLFVPDRNRLDILKEYCDVIDEMTEENDAKVFEVEVDEEDMTIWLSVGLSEFIDYRPGNSMFGELVERAMTVQWEYVSEEELFCRMQFPSIWVEAE